ncbi:hypothetical protein ABK040_000654 [Willaertia magna]
MAYDMYKGETLNAPTSWQDYLDEQVHQDNEEDYDDQISSNNTTNKNNNINNSYLIDPLQFSNIYRQRERQSSINNKEWKARIKTSGKEGSTFLAANDYNPRLFLATKHVQMRYEDLSTAKTNLQSTTNDLNMKMILLIEKNITKFIDAKDVMDELSQRKDAKFRDGSVNRLDNQLTSILNDCENLIKPIIQKKKESENIEKVLALFKKIKFIIYLPSSIKENIKKKEYKKVVHDYNRLKYFKKKFEISSLFGNIFEMIEKDILQLIEDLFLELIKNMEHFTINKLLNENQERIISILINLDSKIDPCFFYLKEMYDYILKVLHKNYETFTNNYMFLNTLQNGVLHKNIKEILENKSILFIEELTNLLIILMSDFWQLCQNILIGKYYNKKKKRNNLTQLPNIENEMIQLIKNITLQYADIINDIINILDDCNPHPIFLCKIIQQITNGLQNLKKLKISKNFIKEFIDFNDLMIRFMINETFNRSIDEITIFYNRENWNTISESLTITELPLQFQDFILKTLKIIKLDFNYDNNLILEIENYLLDSINTFADCFHELAFDYLSNDKNLKFLKYSIFNYSKNEENDRNLLLIISNCSHTRNIIIPNILSNFVNTFYKTILQQEQQENNDNDLFTQIEDDDEESDQDDDEEEEEDNKRNKKDAKVLLKRNQSNSEMITSKNLQHLTNEYMKNEKVQNVLKVYDTLIDLLISTFVRRKSIIFNKIIEKGLLLSGYDWRRSNFPNSIRNYIFDLLMELSLVHSKTEKMTSVSFVENSNLNITREFTYKIFNLFSERIAEIYLYLIKLNDVISENAALQLDIEITYLRKSLQNYETNRTKLIYKKIIKYLTSTSKYNPNNDQNNYTKNNIISETIEKTFTQLDCFDIHVQTNLNLLNAANSFRMVGNNSLDF